MKKLLFLVTALLVARFVGAPNVRADSFTATFACGNFTPCNLGVPATQTVSFPSPNIDLTFTVPSLPSFDSFNVTLPASDAPTDSYQWFFAAGEGTVGGDLSDFTGIVDHTTGLTTQDIIENAGIAADEGGTLTFSPVNAAAPEPMPAVLMLLGAAMIFFLRKRFGMSVSRLV